MICFAIGAGSLIVGVIIKIFPNALFNKIKLFREEEMDQAHMDRSFTSMMRRKSSVRMGTVQGRNFSRDSFSNKSWEIITTHLNITADSRRWRTNMIIENNTKEMKSLMKLWLAESFESNHLLRIIVHDYCGEYWYW